MITLQSTEAVIEALGGPKAVAALTKYTRSPSAVPNWIKRKRFPTGTYRILKEALAEKGATAPENLWGMR